MVTVENLGDRELRFVVGEAARENAPADREAGHLLLPAPGRRCGSKNAAYPLWVWSDPPTTIGVSAALARQEPSASAAAGRRWGSGRACDGACGRLRLRLAAIRKDRSSRQCSGR